MVSYLVPVFINVSSNFVIGNSITEQDVKEMLFSADVDGDGMINYEEFLKVMVGFKQTLDLSPSFSINFFFRLLPRSMVNLRSKFELYQVINMHLNHRI